MNIFLKENFLTALSVCALFASSQAIEKPNIIIFYVDDLGWQDVQLNDVDAPCPYETPNLVQLAEEGMNFSQAYSPAPTCAPSRAGIITGQHPAQIGLTHVDLGTLKVGLKDQPMAPVYLEGHLDTDLLTLADAMNQNGYRTGHVGKWHVGLTAESYGFDFVNQTRGIHRGMDDRTKDFATTDDKNWPLSREKYAPFSKKKPEGISYPYDELTESAIEFMDSSKEGPFFLNMCHWMVHWPMLTRNGELLEYYTDKFGLPFPPKQGDMTLEGQQNPYFAAMVTSVDWSLGRVVNFLKKTDDPRNPGKKLFDTTYIFFTSDNGGAEKKGKEILSDNAPLKYGKKYTEEGGVRVPMVVSGPSVQKQSQFDGLVNQLDYFPTILELTTSKVSPEDALKLSGLDIAPVLAGKSDTVIGKDGADRTSLFWHFPHNGFSMKSAIRVGDFKLYKRYMDTDYQLFQLYKNGVRYDLEENDNLAQNPEFASTVVSLATKLNAELEAVNAEMPHLNPFYSDKTTPSAMIEGSSYLSGTRNAKLTLERSGPAIVEAYVIYRADPSIDKKARRRLLEENEGDEGGQGLLAGQKESATIDAGGYLVRAIIPEAVAAYCFLLIDANNYKSYSEVKLSK